MFESKLFKYIDKADHSEKMTPEMIKRIVSGKESLYALSKELGCSYSYLRLIKQGKIYKPQVAEALKELGLQSAEIHTHDTKLPSEHKAPTANTPFSKPVSLNKTAIINAIDKAATKLKEKGMKRWLKYESKVNKEVKNEVESIHRRSAWLYGPESAHPVYVKYLKQALEGLSVTLKYRNESIELTYDINRMDYGTENDKTDYTRNTARFTFVEKVPIHLNIKGENLKTLLKDGINHNLISTFKADIQVEKAEKEYKASLYHHSVSNNIGSHKSGALTTLKIPLITKERLESLIKEYRDAINKVYRGENYDFLDSYEAVNATKGDFSLVTVDASNRNRKYSSHGDTSSEKHRSGKEIVLWETCIETALKCRGTVIAEIKNAYVLDFKQTKQYGYAKYAEDDGVTTTSRLGLTEQSNLEQSLLKILKSKGHLL